MIQPPDNQEQESFVDASANQDSPEEFGRWVGNKYYSLDIVQHPLRARMCGFGDKDRRPLAPAAVAKMVITHQDNSIVDAEEVDISFFIVTVDLWSADGKGQANLVLHPTTNDRFTPSHPPLKTSKGKTTTRSTPNFRTRASSGNLTPAEQTSPTLGPRFHQDEQQPASATSMNGRAPFVNQAPYDPQQEPNTDGSSPVIQYGHTQPSQPTTWGYNNSPVDRSVAYPQGIQQSYNPQANPESAGNWQPNSSSPEAYREWNSERNYQHVDNSDYANMDQNVDHSLRTPSTAAATPDGRTGKAPWSQPNAYNATPNEGEQSPGYSQSTFQTQSTYTAFPQGSTNSPTPFPATVAVSSLPRHAYTRTLVGPLSANACRLMDEHQKPGIFFLFQDLSVRTEGTFRLRMRLMNVGASPAPEMGALRVHNNVSPVLAQAFTDPFTVFSAKRFPGVPDTTALSIALGNQGQKLPLRNRHGSTAVPKRRRRNNDSESEDDSE